MTAPFRLLSLVFAGALVLSVGASSARADVDVFATANKTFDKVVFETITITKNVDIFVQPLIFNDAAAEQEIFKNQRNQFQFVQDENGISDALIAGGSFDGASGILLVNQAPGFLNNQANEVSVTYANTPFFQDGVFVHANVAVEQINGWDPLDGIDSNGLTTPPDFDQDGIPDPVNVYTSVGNTVLNSDTIDGSFNDAAGIAGVNQSAGSINNQNNGIAIALGDFATFALGELDLGQFNTWNLVNVNAAQRFDAITASFNGFSGVAMVNQSAGAINNQANVVDIAVSLTGLPSAGVPF